MAPAAGAVDAGELAAAARVSVGTVRGIEHGHSKTVRPRVIRAAARGVAPAQVAEFRPSLGLPPAAAAPEAPATS